MILMIDNILVSKVSKMMMSCPPYPKITFPYTLILDAFLAHQGIKKIGHNWQENFNFPITQFLKELCHKILLKLNKAN